ncbi:MAG: hypothetical protein QOE77_4 [Blastocatellia bacterium]|nr:hypothetical protein [Blastocatellia bacterium]
MFLLRHPSYAQIEAFIDSQKGSVFAYPEVGATQTAPPAGYRHDHNRIRLGSGSETYEQACQALKAWKQFDLGWIELQRANTPIAVGATVAVLAYHLGFWSLNAARIVYVIKEETEQKRFGFAYGTLPDHAERGEERFSIEWNSSDDSVWYDILAFSRPNKLAPKLGYPLTRMFQRRFARDSMQRMAHIPHASL